MTLVAFALIVVAVVAMVVFLRREVRRAVEKLTADSEARAKLLNDQQRTLYKQAKTGERQRALTKREADKVIAAARAQHREIQQILCDPKIQGALRRAKDAEEVS